MKSLLCTVECRAVYSVGFDRSMIAAALVALVVDTARTQKSFASAQFLPILS